MSLRSWAVVVGVLLGSLYLAGPAAAQDIAGVAPAPLPGQSVGPANPDGLAAEVAALRQRLDDFQAAGAVQPDVCGEFARPAWEVNADFLYWRLHRRDLDFAIPTDDSSLAVGAGPIEKLDFGYDGGFRVGLARQLSTGWDIGFSYTYFFTSAEENVAEPAGGNLWATRSHPSRYEEASTAAAFSSFKHHIFDLEAGYQWTLSPWANVRMFGGPRWAMIDQQFNAYYDGRDFSNDVVTNPVNMNAFGLRMGLSGNWELGHGFSLFGRGAGSLMYGRFSTRLTETNLSGAETVVNVEDEYQQAVSALEVAAGLSWRYRCMEISVGYELVDWINVGNRAAFVDGNDEGLYSPMSSDLLLEGVFARCVWTF